MFDIYNMCGIAGIVSLHPVQFLHRRLHQMADALAHRGPDGEGFWANANETVGFGHRRLAIIDITDAGAQPMHYLSRYTIVYNGELYNYSEIRETLAAKGYIFRTQTDTEVILAAYACYRQACLQYFDGMFAFAIWDEQEQTLFAARDRFGEKPFFYHVDQSRQLLLFSSEMKALWQTGIECSMNKSMLYNFFTLGYVQNPHDAGETFYNGIAKLPAGTSLTVNIKQFTLHTHTYWKLNRQQNDGIHDHEALENFSELFFTSVKRRLRSDVPVGTSLSGGLDSSSIVAVMAQLQHNSMPFLQTFSAVFPGYEKNESAYVKLVTERFASISRQVEPDAGGLISNFEKLCYHQEEPFSSSSIYAQFAVFALAKQFGVTVLLDGQGADETLAGYDQYYPWFWQELYSLNSPALYAEIQAAGSVGIKAPWNWKNKLAAGFPAISRKMLHASRNIKQQHTGLDKDFIRCYGKSYYDIPRQNRLNEVLLYNTCTNGLEALLRYADRNSMAHGREVRLPFLYHELVEYVFSLPSRFKIRNGRSKWLLRETMKDLLPHAIAWRTGKVGFEPPQKKWMEDPVLQEYTHEAKSMLAKSGILHRSILQKKNQPQEAHAADNHDWRYLVAAQMMK